MTKLEGQHIAPLGQSNGSSVRPPPHWLAMLQERAPHLLESGGPFTVELPASHEDAINTRGLSATSPDKSNVPPLRMLLTWIGEWLLRLGHRLTADQHIKSQANIRSNATHAAHRNKKTNSNQPPSHWLSMVESQAPHLLDSSKSFLANGSLPDHSEPTVNSTANSAVLSPSQNSSLQKRVADRKIAKFIKSNTQVNTNTEKSPISLGRTNSVRGKSPAIPPEPLEVASFSWRLAKFGNWLLSLGRVFAYERHNIAHSKELESSYIKENPSPSLCVDTDSFGDDVINSDAVKDTNMPTSYRSFASSSTPNPSDIKVTQSGQSGINAGVNNEKSLDGSNQSGIAYLSKLFPAKQLDLNLANFSRPLARFSQWLFSLGRTSVDNYRFPMTNLSDFEKGNYERYESDWLRRQFVSGESALQHSDNSNLNWSMAKFGKWLLSLGRIFAAKQHTIIQSGSDANIDSYKKLDNFSHSSQSQSDTEEFQSVVWPTLHDEGQESVDNCSSQELGSSQKLERTAIEDEVKIRETKANFSWPELMSNSFRDTPSSSPVQEQFGSSLAKNSTSLTRVIDTMKERKQRELTGTLWNA